MAYKDPEKKRVYQQQYHLKHRDKQNKRSKEWRKKNPERAWEIETLWRLNNREKFNFNHRKTYQKNRVKRAVTVKIWQQNNRKKINKLAREYSAKNPLKNQAREKVRKAKRNGLITPITCEICGKPQTIAHHEDYNKPLDVWFLCELHHAGRHKFLRLEGGKNETY